jgi:hypothetical protein
MLSDLAALTPPLVVCAALLIAIWAFLRHEMGSARRPGDGASSADISANDQVPDPGISKPPAPPDARTANDGQAETGQDGCWPRQ